MKTGYFLMAASFLGLAVSERVAAITVTQWTLSSRVHDSQLPQDPFHVFNQVINPFRDSHSVSVPPSMAAAAYDFSWTALEATFQTYDVSHTALDVVPDASLFSRTSAFIFFQPSVDSFLDVSGFYTFSLPPNSFSIDFFAVIRDLDTNQNLWGQSHFVHSYGGGAVSGTRTVEGGDIFLPAGHNFRLHYWFEIDTIGGGTGQIGTANGAIQWTITQVPECTSLSLLAMAMLIVVRRRARF